MPIDIIVTSSSNPGPTADNSWIYGVDTFTVTYSTPGTKTVFFGGPTTCCRISSTNVKNNNNGNFMVSSTVTVGNNNDAPVVTAPPIVSMQVNQTAATYTLQASDPNLTDVLSYSLTPPGSYGSGTTQPAGMTINSSTGQISFNTTGKVVGDLYSANITVSDDKGAKVQLDVLFQIVAQSTPPAFVYAPTGTTPTNGITYQVAPGQPVSFSVTAKDNDLPATPVSLSAVGVPGGASFTPGSGNPVTR
ncbi:MAG TPA: hypothetical protein VGB67_00120, partial [Fibrella sp.]